MDLNQLYFDHQLSAMRADGALTCALRRERQHDASLIAGRIGCIQRALSAGAAPGWEALAVPNLSDLSGREHGLEGAEGTVTTRCVARPVPQRDQAA